MKEIQDVETRKVLVILDGMDDEKHEDWGGKTPLECAYMPALEHMRRNGNVTYLNTIPSGNDPATDVALLKILGHEIPVNFMGRAWFEALGEGIEVGDNDLCIRCNLIKIVNGKIASHAVDDISDSAAAIDALNRHFSNSIFKFYPGKGFRNLLVIKNCNSNVVSHPVHNLIGLGTESLHVKCDNQYIQDSLNDFIDNAPDVLADCHSGRANGIAIWAPGKKPDISPIAKEGAVIAGVSIVKGIGKWMGMDVPNIEGATGGIDTNLRAKMDATAMALRNHRFVLLHIEAPDEASHMRNFQKKRDVLEKIDRLVLTPLLNLPFNLDITVQSDHATSSITGRHLSNPVEVVKYLHLNECRDRLQPVMIAGTGSDVGKSVIATALCRIFLQDGFHPAPFKAQNMALNSFATPDGLEIGRAQAVQADACGLECSTDMNPILLKPSGQLSSQVIINGRPVGNRDAYSYFRKEGKEELRKVAHDAFDRLASVYNPIVIEGAGSISELNLKDSDIVNMSMAAYAGASVILVADIDRGGVFASVYGSIMLQSPEDRKRIKGIIINKFRGDLRLFEEGRKIMEEICGVPVLGVVPMAEHIHIEEEDSVSLAKKAKRHMVGKINIAVVLLKHISNFTDFNVLEHHPGINLYYTCSPKDLEEADIVIIPGSKNTIDDIEFLRETGLADAICSAHRKGKTIVGICGGYQILGKKVSDPYAVEGMTEEKQGLGLLPVESVIELEKTTRQVKFWFLNDSRECRGYEIHMGQTETGSPVCTLEDGTVDGCIAEGRCFGSYIHGILDNKAVLEWLLAPFGKEVVSDIPDYAAYKENQYDELARWIRKHVDIQKLYDIIKA